LITAAHKKLGFEILIKNHSYSESGGMEEKLNLTIWLCLKPEPNLLEMTYMV